MSPSPSPPPRRYDALVDEALYGPRGFYTSGGGAGRAGRDFVTSPEIGPLFGAVVARWLDTEWEVAGRPDRFTFVECAAGRGTLIRSIRRAEPACAAALDVVAVERSPAHRAELPDGVRVLADLSELEPVGPGVVFANELLDNLAFRVLASRDRTWWEVVVTVADGIATEGLARYDGPAPIAAPDRPGVRIPLQLQAAAWVERARGVVDGPVVAIDYTTTTADLTHRPAADWLRTYAAHARAGDPLEVALSGAADLTVDVCVDQLPEPTEHVDQATWLRRHGVDDLVEQGRRRWRAAAAAPDLAAFEARSRIGEAEALTEPEGLGGFSVLTWR